MRRRPRRHMRMMDMDSEEPNEPGEADNKGATAMEPGPGIGRGRGCGIGIAFRLPDPGYTISGMGIGFRLGDRESANPGGRGSGRGRGRGQASIASPEVNEVRDMGRFPLHVPAQFRDAADPAPRRQSPVAVAGPSTPQKRQDAAAAPARTSAAKPAPANAQRVAPRVPSTREKDNTLKLTVFRPALLSKLEDAVNYLDENYRETSQIVGDALMSELESIQLAKLAEAKFNVHATSVQQLSGDKEYCVVLRKKKVTWNPNIKKDKNGGRRRL